MLQRAIPAPAQTTEQIVMAGESQQRLQHQHCGTFCQQGRFCPRTNPTTASPGHPPQVHVDAMAAQLRVGHCRKLLQLQQRFPGVLLRQW
jgi:hypothetical protein